MSSVGRLFKLKARHNGESRRQAMATIREVPRGTWLVRVGGLVLGTTLTFRSKAACEHAVTAYYNAKMHEFVQEAARQS